MLDDRAARFDFDADRVEKVLMHNCKTKSAQTLCELAGQAMNAFGDRAKTVRSMINGVHRSNDREQHLRRANIAGSFIAPNMLLPRLQCEAVSWLALSIMRDAD